MKDGIIVRVLGDFGPFSRMGKSIGYLIEFRNSRYLVDCGAPLFQQIGGKGLKSIDGVIITHCHDDHKRWFSDLALFNMYTPDGSGKVLLITSEDVSRDLARASGPSLDRSLSKDSKNVVDLSYEDYVRTAIISPRAKYRIVSRDEGNGRTALSVVDEQDRPVGPERAKIVISAKTGRARLLFKDPEYKEWVEPEHFYPFSSEVFYETDQNIYQNDEGLAIEAIKSPVWHGITAIGIKFRTGKETLIFSSDTARDEELWAQLYKEKRPQKIRLSPWEFERASVIYGDINDYVERAWSRERYQDAMDSFQGAVVIHDVSYRDSVVHTEYDKLVRSSLDRNKVLLTHSPDRMTSEWVLCNTGKSFLIKDGSFLEIVGDDLCRMDADIFHKEEGRYFVGYKNEKGRHIVYVKDGYLGLSSGDDIDGGTPLYRVDLFEDISGQYFPVLDKNNQIYFERKDGRVEVIEFYDKGSKGKFAVDCRKSISRIRS